MELEQFTNTVLELNKLIYPEEPEYWEGKKINYFRREELDTEVTKEELDTMVSRVKAITAFVDSFKMYLDDLYLLQKHGGAKISTVPNLVLKNAAPRTLLLRWSRNINTAMIKGEHYQKWGVLIPPMIRKQYFQLKECLNTSIVLEIVLHRSLEHSLCSRDLIDYFSAVDYLREELVKEGSIKMQALQERFKIPQFPPPVMDDIFLRKKGITQNYGKRETIKENVREMEFIPFDERLPKMYNYSYDYYVEEVLGNKNYIIKYGRIHDKFPFLEELCNLLKLMEASGGLLQFKDLSVKASPPLVTITIPEFKRNLRNDLYVSELLDIYASSESIVIQGVGILSPYIIVPLDEEHECLYIGEIESPFYQKRAIYHTEKIGNSSFEIHSHFAIRLASPKMSKKISMSKKF